MSSSDAARTADSNRPIAVDYDRTDIAQRYDAARQMPQDTMRLWMEALSTHVPASEVHLIVDVGCGTGRFSVALADSFAASLIGVDPSRTMLAQARARISHARVSFHVASGESLPIQDGSACLVFMSMAYHHLTSADAAAAEFERVLRPGGHVCIRNSTLDLLEQVPYLSHFPAAMAINRQRIPAKQQVLETMGKRGLSLVAHKIVEQPFAESYSDYCIKIRQRALSDLAAISDSDFAAGVREMEEAARTAEVQPVCEPIDLFVFEKRSA